MRYAPLAIGLLIASSLPAFAYTQDEASACTPDVFRLCQQDIPDRARITQCLFRHRHDVSAACYAVYKKHVRETVGRGDSGPKHAF